MHIKRIDPQLTALADKMAAGWQSTRCEAIRALWEADELIVVDGTLRLIIPSKPDGRIAG